MRKSIRRFAELVARTWDLPGPIYEFGSYQVEGQEKMLDLRPLFPDKEYIGCDMREGPGVNKVLNLHAIDLPDNSVATVLSFDTLEHVEDPRLAMQEIHRVLQPGGVVVITSVMDFPIHEFPYDYWRFTPEAFKSILKPFQSSFVGWQGKELFPHTVVGIAVKGDMPDVSAFEKEYTQWQDRDKWSLRQIVINLVPPIVLPIVAWLYRLSVSLRTYTAIKRTEGKK
ncbi:MAG: SAM-dependent methyltransferase [Kiritimatiellia bacterium]|jgi:SAM-dependent methyltransferase